MKQRKRVLVIDDDATDCALISRTLEPHGLEIISRLDARGGIEAAETMLPDLVFIKLMLSGTNGLKVSKAIHSAETLRHVPLVVIVSEQGELDPKYTTTIGIVDILVKPLRSSDVLAKTVALLGPEAVMGMGDAMASGSRDDKEVFSVDEDESLAAAAGSDEEDSGMRPAYMQEADTAGLPVNRQNEEGEAVMPEHRSLYEELEEDLFSRTGANPERDMAEPKDENDRTPSPGFKAEEDYTMASDLADVPASPVRRAVIVVASIAAGIAVGVGGYLFFTAGTRQAPAPKQIKEVLPGPAAVPQAVPASPPAHKGAIPEIPVKEEPVGAGKTSHTEAALREPVPQAKAAPAAGRMHGAYIVQAGVFERKDNADALAKKITGMGVAASVTRMDTGKRTLYRVVAGTFATSAEAVTASEDLKRKGITTIVRAQ